MEAYQSNHFIGAGLSKKDVHRYAAWMQSMIGPSPVLLVDSFRNWSRSQVRRRVIAVTPTTVDETRAVILAARKLGLRVRAAGKTHSWSPLYTDEGHVVIHVCHLQRPNGRPKIEMAIDSKNPGQQYVTMAASATTGEFMQFQLDNNICIPTNVVLRVVQMGGVISTGSHGVGLDAGTVGDDVVSMRIINSDGQLVEYSMGTDPDMMLAVQCSLGLFGIIVDFTIKVQPMMYVETQNTWMTVKDLFYNKANLARVVFSNWSVELFWFPFNSIKHSESVEALWDKNVDFSDWNPEEDEVLIRLVNKTGHDRPTTSESAYRSMDIKAWLQTKCLQLVDGLITKFQFSAPAFLKSQVSFLKSQYKGKTIEKLPHAVHFRDFIEDLRIHDMEWCFNLDHDCTNLSVAIRNVVQLVQKEALAGRFPMTLPLEMRFLSQSDSYLSPMVCANPKYGGSGYSCFIEVLTLDNTPIWNDYCQNVAHIWSQMQGARPHWAKEWSFLKGIDDHIRKANATQFAQFLTALNRSGADPDGIFLNDRLERLFYPQGFPRKRIVCLPSTEDRHTRNQSQSSCRLL